MPPCTAGWWIRDGHLQADLQANLQGDHQAAPATVDRARVPILNCISMFSRFAPDIGGRMRRLVFQDGSLTCADGKLIWNPQLTSRQHQDELLRSAQPAPPAGRATQPHGVTGRHLAWRITESMEQGATGASWWLPASRFPPNRRGIVRRHRFRRSTPWPYLWLLRHAVVRSRGPPADDSFTALHTTRSGGRQCAGCGI